jgi:hypothetical protein
MEAELAEVEQAEKALPPVTHHFTASDLNVGAQLGGEGKATISAQIETRAERFAQMTIKQLVMAALRAKHPEGLDATQMREFIRDAYNRAIVPDSLRPQLVRLKSDGWIVARANIWHLTDWALVHDHPRSMNVTDEPSEGETAASLFVNSTVDKLLEVKEATDKAFRKSLPIKPLPGKAGPKK